MDDMRSPVPRSPRAEHAYRWLTWATARPLGVFAWAVFFLMAGGWAAAHLAVEWIPSLERRQLVVEATWPGAPPGAVEQRITVPIEQALQGIRGTAQVDSTSDVGHSRLHVKIAPESDLKRYVVEVGEALASLRGVLPVVVTPEIQRLPLKTLATQDDFMVLQLVGPGPPQALGALAEEPVARALRDLSGVGEVTVEGGGTWEIRVTPNLARLSSYGLGPWDLQQRLEEALALEGSFELRDQGQLMMAFVAAPDALESLRRYPVRAAQAGQPAVDIEAVADLRLTPAPLRGLRRINGESVVTLRLARRPDSRLLAVAEQVRSALAELRLQLPEPYELRIASDVSERVREHLLDLSQRGVFGLGLLTLVLVLMLGSLRATGVVAFAVAVALAFAFLLMRFFGLSFNLLTLAGLVLLGGLLVDNSVVVVEQLIRHLRGSEAASATARSLDAVLLPLLGGTLTSVIVLAPLVYLSGELRSLLIGFSFLAASTLPISLLSSALVIPPFAPVLRSPRRPTRPARGWRRFLTAPVTLAVTWPRLSIAALILLLGLPFTWLPHHLTVSEDPAAPGARFLVAYNRIMSDDFVAGLRHLIDRPLGGLGYLFFQRVEMGKPWAFLEEPRLSVRIAVPASVDLRQMDRIIQGFETDALAAKEVERVVVAVDDGQARMDVWLTEHAVQGGEAMALRERLVTAATRLAGMEVSVSGLATMGYHAGYGGPVSTLSLNAYGPNYEALSRIVEGLAQRLANSPGVSEVRIDAGPYGFERPGEFLELWWSPQAALRTGVSTADLFSHLAPFLPASGGGPTVDLVSYPGTPVHVEAASSGGADLAGLLDATLGAEEGAWLRLGETVAPQWSREPSTIERRNQQYRRYIHAFFAGPSELGKDVLEHVVSTQPLRPGYRLEPPPRRLFTTHSAWELSLLLVGCSALVYLVLSSVLNSWRAGLLASLGVPTAAIGVAVGFLWSGAHFGEGALIGSVLLIGIATNDSLLLLHAYGRFCAARPSLPRRRAIQLAVRARLRPVWTTTLTSIAGMAPLLMFSRSSDFWLGLAVVVVSGLLSATCLAPFAMAALISVGERHSGGSVRPPGF